MLVQKTGQLAKKHKRKRLMPGLLLLAAAIAVLASVWQQGRPDFAAASSKEDAKSGFEVHFIDVGQGDAALILCDGHAMLIDGGGKSQSDKIFTYLKDRGIDQLDYIVASHADTDHVGGLSGALHYASAKQALAPVKEASEEAFSDFVDSLQEQNVSITVPAPGDTFSLGERGLVTVLGPVRQAEEDNNNSLVLKVECGSSSFLFTGDAEDAEEQDIMAEGKDLSATVLKAAHHGSAYSTSDQWLSSINPQYAVISCGKDNEYGHPTEETLKRLDEHGVIVLRTDLQGDIIFREETGILNYEVEKNADADTLVPGSKPEGGEDSGPQTRVASGQNQTREGSYILNVNTHKFHYPGCKSLNQMKEKNKKEFTGDRQELIDSGYEPCGNCNP